MISFINNKSLFLKDQVDYVKSRRSVVQSYAFAIAAFSKNSTRDNSDHTRLVGAYILPTYCKGKLRIEIA